MKLKILFFLLIIGVLFSSCSKNQTQQEIDFMKCETEAKSLVPQSLTLEFENDPFKLETLYILKIVRWGDTKSSLTNRGFRKKTIGQDDRYFPLGNDNAIESSWFYTDAIIYNRTKSTNNTGLNIEFDFLLIPTKAIFYEEKYIEATKELIEDHNRGRRVFDIDEIKVKKCTII